MAKKTLQEYSALGVKAFERGREDLLYFRHDEAKKAFSLSASHFYKASQLALGVAKLSELQFNAAIAHYYAGNYRKAQDFLGSCSAGIVKTNSEKAADWRELSELVRDRCKESYWIALRKDYAQIKANKDYNALLDIIRAAPYLMSSVECKRAAAEACISLGHEDVARSILAN